MNFSVVLISKNEARVLPRLLDSLKEFQDKGGKIILCDTGSTDDTREIAKLAGCEVIEAGDRFIREITPTEANAINRKFIVEGEEAVIKAGDKLFDYSSARNYAVKFSPTDMVATPDCDEVYTKLDLQAVAKLIDSGVEQLEYDFVFAHDEQGNETIKFAHSKFYNHTKLSWTGIVHEVLKGDAKRQYVSDQVIKLEHYQEYKESRKSYLTGLALDCYENPTNERNSHYFGRELLWTGRPKSAIKELERCISMHWWAAEKCASAVFIGDAYGLLNEPDKQVEWYNKAIWFEGSLREPFIKLARFYQHNNNPTLAAAYASAAMQLPWVGFYANNMAYYTTDPNEIMYWAKGWLGEIDEAKRYINKCLEYSPENSEYLRDLRFYYDLPKVSVIIPQLGREDGLKKCIDSIKALNYPEDKVEIIIIEGEETVPSKVATGLFRSTGDYIAYGANDMEFSTNSVILAIKESIDTGKGLLAFDSGVRNDEGYINEHFIIRKDLIAQIGGEIFDTEFHHVGVDDLLWKKCVKLNQAMISRGKITHNHFSRIGSGVVADDIIKKGYANAEADRKLLAKKIKQLAL